MRKIDNTSPYLILYSEDLHLILHRFNKCFAELNFSICLNSHTYWANIFIATPGLQNGSSLNWKPTKKSLSLLGIPKINDIIVVFVHALREEGLRHLEYSRVASALFEFLGKFSPSVVLVLINDVIISLAGSVVTTDQRWNLCQQVHLGVVERHWQCCHFRPLVSDRVVEFSWFQCVGFIAGSATASSDQDPGLSAFFLLVKK